MGEIIAEGPLKFPVTPMPHSEISGLTFIPFLRERKLRSRGFRVVGPDGDTQLWICMVGREEGVLNSLADPLPHPLHPSGPPGY